MSGMNFVEKLLDGVAVEWKPLGDLFEFKNGINKEKEFFGSGNSIINYTDVFKNNKLLAQTILGKVESTPSDINRFDCQIGDVFFTRTSETKDEIGYAAVLLSNIPKCVFSGFLIRARPSTNLLLPEYCAYCFTSSQLRKEIIHSSNMTTRVTTTGTILSKIKIPIPPLKVQAEIVRILDTFTALTAELTAELTARKKQYNYYRDRLLTFEKGEAEWEPLGELAENLDFMRKPVTSGLRDSGEIPYYGASGIVDYVKDYIFDGDFLLVSEDGANLVARNTPIAFSISGKSWVNNHAHILKFNNYVERRYIEYYLNSIDLTPYI